MEKKKISNSEELNKYYKLVNDKVKKFSDMDIPHNKIAKYLKPGSENFKKFINDDSELKDVDGIKVVLKDIVNDIYGAFKDGLYKKMKLGMVKKFESLNAQDMLDFSIDSENEIHEHEKALADIYKISISYINLVNKNLHMYSIDDIDGVHKVCIFSEDEIKEIKEKIVNYLSTEVKSKHVELKWNNKIALDNIIDIEKVKGELFAHLNNDNIIEIIGQIIGFRLDVKFNEIYKLNSINYYVFDVIR